MTITSNNPRNEFRQAAACLSEQWLTARPPSRRGLDEAASELERLHYAVENVACFLSFMPDSACQPHLNRQI